MRINGHAHIFNLHSVLTPHAVRIMVDRIRSLGVPDFVADAVEKFLREQLGRPEFLVEEELLARFVRHIAGTKSFRGFLKRTGGLPVEIRLLGKGAGALQVATLRSALQRISSWFDDGAETTTTVGDVYETLHLAMQADIAGVAGKIFEGMGPGDGLVALMMDITSEQWQAKDEAKFLAQLKGTADAALAFPGRVFPFVAVNTRRQNHYALMREAIERHGFVGVKLYPSLGTPVDSDAMMEVYEYCVAGEVPILLHCTLTGFYESDETKQLGSPERWWPILDRFPSLRVCFAHAGGLAQGVLTPDGPTTGQWPADIEALMLSYPDVYCDLAYHVDQMISPEAEGFYLKWLRRLLRDARLGDRVMFGTDVWLVRLSLADDLYWRWFEDKLTAAEQARIMESAPAGFLGLPDANGQGMRANVERLVRFLETQPGVGAEPAAWLHTVSTHGWNITRANPGWTPNNRAHAVTHAFLRYYMTDAQKKLEFADAGKLRLRQLTYWRNAPQDDPIFREDCTAIGQSLAIYCRNSGSTFEGDHDATSTIGKLADVVADGEKTLAEAAAAVDAVFRFATETF